MTGALWHTGLAALIHQCHHASTPPCVLQARFIDRGRGRIHWHTNVDGHSCGCRRGVNNDDDAKLTHDLSYLGTDLGL